MLPINVLDSPGIISSLKFSDMRNFHQANFQVTDAYVIAWVSVIIGHQIPAWLLEAIQCHMVDRILQHTQMLISSPYSFLGPTNDIHIDTKTLMIQK